MNTHRFFFFGGGGDTFSEFAAHRKNESIAAHKKNESIGTLHPA